MNEDSQRLLQQAASRSPLISPWGYFFTCESPAATGIACFCWFENREDLLSFIERHQLHVCPALPGVDLKAVGELLRLACHFTRAGRFSQREGLTEINRSLEGTAKVEWWGEFRDLATGDAEFPRQIREWYRLAFLGEPDDPSPVPPEEWEAFAKALQAYRP